MEQTPTAATSAPDTSEAPPAAPAAEPVIYTTSWCGFCARLKVGLTREGVPFREIDIETTPGAADVVMQVNGGNRTVPTVVFADGSALTNPSVREVKAKLAA